MFSIMMTDMWVTVKKRLTTWMLYMIIGFGSVRILENIVMNPQIAEALSAVKAVQMKRVLISLLLLLILYQFAQEITLRICRGMFVCGAGKKERMRYLIEQFSIKLLFSFLFLMVVLFMTTRDIFITGNEGAKAVQIILWFFTIWNINLKVGIGIKGARKLDEKGYAVYSKAEIAVNIYWFCFILIQNIVFYTCSLLDFFPGKSWMTGILVVMLISNGYFGVRYFKPVLMEAMSYENVYRQEPEKEYVQYDI